jgi:PAS domain S-box-containing protein
MREEAEIVKELREMEKSGSFSDYDNNRSFNDNDASNNKILNVSKFDFNLDNSFNIENFTSELYQKLIENSLEGIFIIDLEGNIIYGNPAAINIFGYKSINDIIDNNLLSLIHPDYHNNLIIDQKFLFINNDGVLNTYKAIKANKDIIWIEALGYKITISNKKAFAVFVRDITKRQKTWFELVKIGDKYKALAEMSTDGIIIIDHLGRISYANKSFEKLSGKNKTQLNGQSFRDYISKESIYHYQELFIGARKTGKKIKDIELEFINSDKEKIPIELSLSPLKDVNNEFLGIACTIHDITIHKKIENELIKSRKLKTEFMNIAAHELKSPITPIKGYLDLIISDEKANSNTKKWGKISLRNTERLLSLINDILDVSRLDNDTMSFSMEKIDPKVLLNETIEDIKPIIKNKNLNLIKKIPNKLPYILADKCRLGQVIKNLLGNALKFTDEGEIVIEAKVIDDKLEFIVEDTGIGIPKNDRDKIFLKFYQAYTGNDRKCEGTGLGLFICREIIKRHNGKIWVKSKKNIGSKFFIELPII